MLTRIRARHIRLTGELRSHIEHRIDRTFGRIREHVRQVEVRLADENGPRGGVDKICRIEARLHPRGRVVIEARHHDVFTVVGRTLERAGRAALRGLDRVGRGPRRRTPIVPPSAA